MILQKVPQQLGRKSDLHGRHLILKSLKNQRRPLTFAEILKRIKKNPDIRISKRYKQKLQDILYYESKKPGGLFIKIRDGYEPRERVERRLRKRIRNELKSFGYKLNGGINPSSPDTKKKIRNFHNSARKEKYEENKGFLDKREDDLLEHFAEGKEINVKNLWPRLEVVKSNSEASDIFRYATFLWSVPVSNGFGRRVRFLVWDEHTDKLIGLFALGDPVFNLTCRDDWIGWTYHDRVERLYNVMDVFVLGSVPPYNTLLGGKLTAMLATSNEVREVIHKRYKRSKTVIQGKYKDPTLALLTTGSALGKSSLYDRIRYDGRVIYQRIGESKGWGHFHLNNGLFEEFRDYVDGTVKGKTLNRFGKGPNWKIRVASEAIRQLGLPKHLLRHGIKREIYAVPLSTNFKEFLRGEASRLKKIDQPFDSLAEHWKERWLYGRAERKPGFKDFKRERISEQVRVG